MRALWPGVVGRHLYWIGVLVHDSHQAAGFLLCVTCFVESLHDGVQLRFDVQADDVQSGFLLPLSAQRRPPYRKPTTQCGRGLLLVLFKYVTGYHVFTRYLKKVHSLLFCTS